MRVGFSQTVTCSGSRAVRLDSNVLCGPCEPVSFFGLRPPGGLLAMDQLNSWPILDVSLRRKLNDHK
jgi:hypothetical protein